MSLTFLSLLLFSYFLGSIPTGLILGRLFADVDIREHGSGNIGATNVNRVLGRKLGAATLLCDMLKGLFPTLLAQLLLQDNFLASMVGIAALVGHTFPIYLRFKGGKGVATGFGVIFPIAWIPALIAMALWLLTVKISKFSSLGALVASISIPITSFWILDDMRVITVLIGMVILIIYRHKENIERLSAGAELK